MHRDRVMAALLVSGCALVAQDGAPGFVPKTHLVRAAAEDVPRLLAQLPQSAIGKLLDEPEVAAAWEAGLARYRQRTERSAALYAAAHSKDVPLDPWISAQLATQEPFHAVREIELADLLRFELLGLVGDEDARTPNLAVLAQCSPRAEGRWSHQFDQRVQRLRQSRRWRPQPDAKFGGFPAHVFRVEDADEAAGSIDARTWMLHLPGLFAFGSGTPESCGTMAPLPAMAEPQVIGEMNLAAYLEMFARMGGTPGEFTALGFAGLKYLRWRWRFQDALLLDEWEVEPYAVPQGLVGSLLAGTAELPAQPLPDGALAQVRAGLDVKLLLRSLRDLGGGEALPEPIEQLVEKAFTGGVAIGVAPPSGVGPIPRIFVSLGIADDAALDELLAKLLPAPATGREHEGPAPTGKKVVYSGTECTVVTLRDFPAGIQPTFCRLDGVLHVAESGLSMRAFLKARSAGGEAMDTGDAPMPAGPGEVLPNFDVRCDEQALYRTFHQVWLPLLALIPDDGELQPLLSGDEMPAPDAVLPLLGRSRGVLRKDGSVYRLQQLGPLGGVETAAMAMTWGPLLSGVFHRDWTTQQIEHAFARAQLEAAWTAFETFRQKNERWPKDLGELFAAGGLADDALLLPGDDMAEPVAMPAGDARRIHSSFRYFPKPVTVADGQDSEALLIALRPMRFGRGVLTTTGELPPIWGPESQKPIDQFGK